MSKVSKLIEQRQPITLEAIEYDLLGGDWDALYHAEETQIGQLIDEARIDEDFYSRWQDYQEEMRCLRAEAEQEFGGGY